MVSVYNSYERKDGSWSCGHLMGKGLLAPEDLTLAKKELQALSCGADIATVISSALEGWMEDLAVFSDSEISLC